jgi:hypothetical protein
LNRMAKITNSDESLPLDGSFTCHIGIQERAELRGPGVHPKGKFFHNVDQNSEFNCLLRRKCIVWMRNDDNLCVARSLVILDAQKRGDGSYRTLINVKNANSMGDKGLKKNALDLQLRAGLDADKAVTFQDLPKFEKAMGAQILVVDQEMAYCITYAGAEEKDKKFFLFKTGNHVHPITNLNAFWNKGAYCVHCRTAYRPGTGHRYAIFIFIYFIYYYYYYYYFVSYTSFFLQFDHPSFRCARACGMCMSDNCPWTQASVKCEDCSRTCRSKACLDRHKESPGLYKRGPKKGQPKPSHCETRWRCEKCCKTFVTAKMNRSQHDCNKFQCRQCNQYVPKGEFK